MIQRNVQWSSSQVCLETQGIHQASRDFKLAIGCEAIQRDRRKDFDEQEDLREAHACMWSEHRDAYERNAQQRARNRVWLMRNRYDEEWRAQRVEPETSETS